MLTHTAVSNTKTFALSTLSILVALGACKTRNYNDASGTKSDAAQGAADTSTQGAEDGKALVQLQGVTDAKPLHQNVDNKKRYDVIKDVRLVDVRSAPGHQELRDPAKVLGIADAIRTSSDNGHAIFAKTERMILNVFTKEKDGKVYVGHIEVIDGNHRFAGGLHAACTNNEVDKSPGWEKIGDIPESQLEIRVNGWTADSKETPHWIPLHCAKDSKFPSGWWFEVPAGWGAKDKSAQMAGGVSGMDPRFSEDCRSVGMLKVVSRSLERTGDLKGKTYSCKFSSSVAD